MKPPEDCESIEDIREAIDTIDWEIIRQIGHRASYVEAAARFKTGEHSVRAPERQRKLLETRRRWAEENGLAPDVIEALYRNLLSYFVDREMRQWRET